MFLRSNVDYMCQINIMMNVFINWVVHNKRKKIKIQDQTIIECFEIYQIKTCYPTT